MLHIIMLQQSSLPIYFVNNNKIKSWLGQFKNLLQELDKCRRRVHAASNVSIQMNYTLLYRQRLLKAYIWVTFVQLREEIPAFYGWSRLDDSDT